MASIPPLYVSPILSLYRDNKLKAPFSIREKRFAAREEALEKISSQLTSARNSEKNINSKEASSLSPTEIRSNPTPKNILKLLGQKPARTRSINNEQSSKNLTPLESLLNKYSTNKKTIDTNEEDSGISSSDDEVCTDKEIKKEPVLSNERQKLNDRLSTIKEKLANINAKTQEKDSGINKKSETLSEDDSESDYSSDNSNNEKMIKELKLTPLRSILKSQSNSNASKSQKSISFNNSVKIEEFFLEKLERTLKYLTGIAFFTNNTNKHLTKLDNNYCLFSEAYFRKEADFIKDNLVKADDYLSKIGSLSKKEAEEFSYQKFDLLNLKKSLERIQRTLVDQNKPIHRNLDSDGEVEY